MNAPNYRHGQSCANCDYGILTQDECKNIICNCDKYGDVIPGGICDDWEED